jgi:hypothetical protein
VYFRESNGTYNRSSNKPAIDCLAHSEISAAQRPQALSLFGYSETARSYPETQFLFNLLPTGDAALTRDGLRLSPVR